MPTDLTSGFFSIVQSSKGVRPKVGKGCKKRREVSLERHDAGSRTEYLVPPRCSPLGEHSSTVCSSMLLHSGASLSNEEAGFGSVPDGNAYEMAPATAGNSIYSVAPAAIKMGANPNSGAN